MALQAAGPLVRTLVAVTFAGTLLVAGGLAAAQTKAPSAQPSPAPTAAPPAGPAADSPDSPRASLRSFFDRATSHGDYVKAARHLELTDEQEARGPELARRLAAVLERHVDVDIDALSPQPEGNQQDGLPAGVEALGRVPDGRGGEDSVFLVRRTGGPPPQWRFSGQTVSEVDGWYDALPDRWARDWVPQPLQRSGPGGLLWWQWLALPVLLLVALGLGRLLGGATGRLLTRITERTSTSWDDRLLARVAPALTLLWATAVAAMLLPRLALLPGAQGTVRSLLGGLATFAVFWSIWRSVDVWTQFLMERPWAADNASARSLLLVSRNLVKVFVAVAGVVATLAAFGYPVVTVLAGLGIGGVALAFGAQKTIENLFGSIAIAADQPFRVGDFVRIEDFTGNVERIGMRSTQVRTLDRTLVTLPNGKLADMRIEDFASRDRIRFAATVSLVYGTRREQVERIVDGIERLLRAQLETWPDTVVAKLSGLGPSSLDVEVVCWYRTTDFDRFRVLRQEALLGILQVVEDAGTSLAFPTRTVHLAQEAGPGGGQRFE